MNYCLTIFFVSHVKETTSMCVNAIGIRLAYKLHAVRYNKLQLVPKRKMKRQGHLNQHIEYLHVFIEVQITSLVNVMDTQQWYFLNVNNFIYVLLYVYGDGLLVNILLWELLIICGS